MAKVKNQGRGSYQEGNPSVKRQVKNKNVKTGGNQGIDYSLLLIVFFLVIFGLVILYSTSSYESALQKGDAAYYLKHQLLATGIGFGGFAFCAFFNYHLYEPLTTIIYFAATVLLVLVKFIGVTVNGAKRWIYIGPLSFQPAEVSKISVIIITALMISKMSDRQIRSFKGMCMILTPSFFHAFLILVITRNMSSALIVLAIACGMYFVGSRDYKRFIAIVLGVGAAGGAWIYTAANGIVKGDFRSSRIVAWLDPAAHADGVGFQTLQALYGIGSGGMLGKGLGQSMQKLGYIPEAQNDMVFSIICEELGVFGAASVMALFLILCWRIMIIANESSDAFGGMLATGVFIHIAVQVVLNIAVVTNTIPNTGISLPFISYGGTSVLFLLAEMGMVINISRFKRRKEIK